MSASLSLSAQASNVFRTPSETEHGGDERAQKPSPYHGAIDARLKELHRRAVPQDVRRHPFGRQRRTSLTGDTHMLGQERLDAVGAEPAPCTLGNNTLASPRADSLSHALRAIRACVVSGVHRSFRPLPTHRTCAPAPMSSLSRPISSERRDRRPDNRSPRWRREARALNKNAPTGSRRRRGQRGVGALEGALQAPTTL